MVINLKRLRYKISLWLIRGCNRLWKTDYTNIRIINTNREHNIWKTYWVVKTNRINLNLHKRSINQKEEFQNMIMN